MYEIIKGCIDILDEILEEKADNRLYVIKAALEVVFTELDMEADEIYTG